MRTLHYFTLFVTLIMSSALFGAGHIVSINKTDATCFGSSNGTADVIVSGGTGPFSFSWGHGPTAMNLTGLTAGTYTVVVTDDSDASTVTESVTIGEPAEVPIPITIPILNVCENSGFTLTASNIPGATYAWVGPNAFGTTQQNPSVANASNFLSINDSITFTVRAYIGGCPSGTNTTLVVIQPAVLPTFVQFPPFCEGSTAPTLPNPSSNGFNGTWMPGLVSNTSTGSYTFTPNAGQCATSTSLIVTVSPADVPVFNQIPPICYGETTPGLPSVSNQGIAGSWNPVPMGILPAGTHSFTFTPDAGACAKTTTLTITVIPATVPTFNQFPAYCQGDVMPALPIPSTNGISGTWNPPVIDNMNTMTYTFTPNAGVCGMTTSLTVTINPTIFPSFAQLGPYCTGDAIPSFTTTSTNGVSGTWSPAMDNTTTTTYTFTPFPGQCEQSTTMTIVINPAIVPTFNPIPPLCGGEPAPVLQTTSTNNISGTWAPSTVDNTTTGTYYFTPNVGNCATTAELVVTVGPPSPPFFVPIGAICSGTTPVPVLPTTSANGVTGTWNPAVVNTSTSTTYVFTPNAGICATTTDMTITVNPTPTAVVTNNGPVCEGSNIMLFAQVANPSGVTYQWTGPNLYTATTGNPTIPNATVLNSGVYSVVVSNGMCSSAPVTNTVTVNPTPATPVASSNAPLCNGTDLHLICETTYVGAQYSWSGPSGFSSASQNPNLVNPTLASAGTYFLTVSKNGCNSATGSTEVVFNVNPTIVVPSSVTTCPNVDVQISASGADSYVWTPAAGLNNTTNANVFANVTTTTTYHVVGTTAGGCVGEADVTVNVVPNLTINVNPSNPTICAGQSVVLNASGATNYNWSPTTGLSTTSSATVVASPSVTTTYVVDGVTNGCVGQASVTVTVSGPCGVTPTFNPIPPICQGTTAPSLPSASNEGITGTWNPTIIDNNSTSSYTFIPDAGQNATTTSMTVVVGPPTVPVFSPYGPYCAGSTMLALPTTSNNGIMGAWSPSVVNNMTSGTYFFTPFAGSCATTANLTITITPATVPTFNPIAPICQGASLNGLPTVSNQGFFGTWSPAPGGTLIATTTYTFTPSAGACATTTTLTVTVIPSDLNLTTTSTPISSCGQCNATATVNVGSGSGTFTYNWSSPGGYNFTSSNSSGSSTISNICAGTYKVYVTASTGCSDFENVTIDDGTPLDATFEVKNEDCGQKNGSIIAKVTGFTGNLTYSWAPGGQTSEGIFQLASGNYTVVIHDGTGCSITRNVTVLNVGSPSFTFTTSPAACGGATGTIKIFATGGVAPYQYAINGGAFGTSNEFTNLTTGFYQVQVKSSTNCISSRQISVGNVNNLSGYITTVSANCSGLNGSATAIINGSTSGLSYLWSNGATTQTISNVPFGQYSCVVTNGNSCSVSLWAYISSSAPIYVGYGYSYAMCDDGVLTAYVYGGQAPYTYLWSPGGQTTSTITGLSTGQYQVQVTDSKGCQGFGNFSVFNNNYSTISGNIYNDVNGNCVKDAGDLPLKAIVTARNSVGQVFQGSVSSNGNYKVYVDGAEGNYSLECVISGNSSYALSSCVTNTVVNLTGVCAEVTFDFPYTSTQGQNLAVRSHCGVARPGFVQNNTIYYDNYGTTTMSGTVKLDIDPMLTLLGVTPAPTRMVGNHLEWDFVGLNPTQSRQIQYNCQVPTVQNGGTLGTPIDNVMSINPVSGDIHPADNQYACGNVIVGSYDPNMKEVYSPQADESGAIDSSGAELFYTVHFQNTGTDTAFTVVVRDTLSPFVDISSIRFLGASHNYTWSIQPNRCLEVRFDNILLVDSNRNEAGSHGHFDFRINTIKDLPLYASIDNTADIYFDFNEPVITNTVSSPIVAFAGLNKLEKLVSRVYPNPVNTEDINVEVKGMTATDLRFEITDANGRVVNSSSVGDQAKFKISVAGMNSGMYFFTITNDEGAQQNGKLVVTH